jgi:hypothetical protein
VSRKINLFRCGAKQLIHCTPTGERTKKKEHIYGGCRKFMKMENHRIIIIRKDVLIVQILGIVSEHTLG